MLLPSWGLPAARAEADCGASLGTSGIQANSQVRPREPKTQNAVGQPKRSISSGEMPSATMLPTCTVAKSVWQETGACHLLLRDTAVQCSLVPTYEVANCPCSDPPALLSMLSPMSAICCWPAPNCSRTLKVSQRVWGQQSGPG